MNHLGPQSAARRAARALVLSALMAAASSAHAGFFFGGGNSDSGCGSSQVAAITSGYGADGSYTMSSQEVDNPKFRRKPAIVFLPQGAEGKRPVIFFSHGYGPNMWEGYKDLITHLVSRGYIVVYSTYPMLRATMDERYDALWAGFQAAVNAYGGQMDLSHVGFLGHSFGGGATPAMAFRGLVQQGWGRQGAFLMELAPWYAYQMTDSQFGQLPSSAVQVVEVYEKDDTNDHRMAIDIYKSSDESRNYFFMVTSASVGDCKMVADHSTPGRSAFIRLKQYGVFRPLDALADYTLGGSSAAGQALASMGGKGSAGSFDVLYRQTNPTPIEPESFYKFPWSGDKNPRAN